MNTLLLVALLGVIGCFFAAPIFEFVFATLLLAPLLKFLLARILLSLGVVVGTGWPQAALYLVAFVWVFALTGYIFGKRKSKILRAEFYPLLMFAVVFISAYWMCLMWPDFISMGERLRDYALLTSAIDSPVVPREPWMEGATLNYYVFWYRFGAMLSALLYIPAWDAYHTILAFSLAFYSAVIFQVVRVVIGGSGLFATFAAVVLPFGSNIAGVMGWKRAEKGGFVPDEGWWGPSRVIRGAIDEFPAWSFLLGDAHPHFLNLAALPFFILILYYIVTSASSVSSRALHAVTFVLAAALFLVGSNAWEVPMWLGTAIMFGLVAWIVLHSEWYKDLFMSVRELADFEMIRGITLLFVVVVGAFIANLLRTPDQWGKSLTALLFSTAFAAALFPWKARFFKRSIKAIGRSFDLIVVASWTVIFAALILSSNHISSGEGGKLEFVREPVFLTTIGELFTHWGFHLFFLSVATILLFELSLSTLFIFIFMAVTLLYEKAALFIYVLIGLQLLRLFTEKRREPTWRVIFSEGLVICSLGLLLLPEIAFLNDSYGGDNERMNTIFKVYTTAWGLLGLAAVGLSHRVYVQYRERLNYIAPGLPAAIAGFLGVIVLIGSARLYAHTLPMRKIEQRSPQRWSEGLGIPDKEHPGSATIIRVLRDKPHGRVLEAQGNPYSYTSFVSTLAGQPCYIGWINHVGLLTKNHGETGRRGKITIEIYNEADCAVRKATAEREQIRYIVVGTLENKRYSGASSKDYSCFTQVTHDRDYTLYQVG